MESFHGRKKKGQKRKKQHKDNIVLYTQRKKDMSNDRTYGQRKITPNTDGFPRQHTETKQKLEARN